MQQRSRAAAQVLVATGLFAGVLLWATNAAAQQPDFTGVWTNYTEPGQGRAGGAGRGGGPALPMTDIAKQKTERYRALVTPTGDTPGGFCLGSGMPQSMLGSGGYPMEIHQRPEQIIIVYEAQATVSAVERVSSIFSGEERTPVLTSFGLLFSWYENFGASLRFATLPAVCAST